MFFANSGTEANEAALLLATQNRRSNQVLAMRNSYHGRAFGTVAITGNRGWSASSLSPVNVQYVQGAYRYRSPFRDLPDAEYIKVCVDDLRNVIETTTAGDVACLIVEPIQGVGGFSSPPDGLYAAFKEVLDEYGILLISDEVQTGWGRTGEHFWGIQAHDVVPDAMTFAKGLGNGFAIGGVVAQAGADGQPERELAVHLRRQPDLHQRGQGDDRLPARPRPAGQRGQAWRPVDRRAARHLGGVPRARRRARQGPDARGRDRQPEDDKPDAATTARLQQETKNRGLLIGKGGLYGNVLRMAPPMTLTEEETTEALEILRDSFNTLR